MIVGKLLDGLSAKEFDQLMSQVIEREDPDAMSLEALDDAARQRLVEAATTTRIELTGTIHEGRIIFDPPADVPILAEGNELFIGGLRLVVKLREES